MKNLKYILVLVFLKLSIQCLAQQPFTAGNIVVYRVGNGNSLLSRAYEKVYLDEYTPDGVLVQSILMPTENNGSSVRLTARGNNSGMGFLNLTADGKKLVVPGINAALTDDPSTTNPTASVIGLVDFNGSVNTSTAVTDNTEGFFTLSATSDDGNNIWFRIQGGLRYTTAGSSTSVKLNANSTDAAAGDIKIAGGQLYNNTTTVPFFRAVGTGLPTTAGQTFAGLQGIPNNIQGAGQFAFADLDPNVPGMDVLYIASTAETISPAVGIRKFSLGGGTWVENGSVGGDVANSRYQGLTIKVSGSSVTIFATRQGNNSSGVRGGELVKMVDNSGYNGVFIGTPVVIASVTTPNTMAFRGVALVPQPAPFTPGDFVVYRTGTGTTTIAGEIVPVYIDEYTPDGVLVQSIAMPTAANGTNNILTTRASLGTRRYINLSSDGKSLVVPGVNVAPGPFTPSTASVIGVIDFNAKINTSTVVTDFSESLHTPVSIASDDGQRFWMSGGSAIRYATLGSNSSVLLNNTSGTTTINLSIADGGLFVNRSAQPSVNRVGSGLPVTTGQTLSGLPGLPNNIQSGGAQFAFADLNADVPGVDVLYIASPSTSTSTTVGIRKFSLVVDTWIDNGSVGGDIANSNYRGLTIKVSGTTVTIFSTRQGDNSSSVAGGDLVKLVDNSGYNGTLSGTPTVLANIKNRFGAVNVASFGSLALVPVGCRPVRLLRVPDIAATEANIRWDAPSDGAGNYEYALTTSFLPPASGTATSSTRVHLTGLTVGTTYYVHVRTSCSTFSQSEWSTTSFVTGCKAPAAPAVSFTISGSGALTAKWTTVFGATSYEYMVSTNTTPPSSGTAITDTTFTMFNLSSVTPYYLHVRSNCGGGTFSPWTTKAFTTDCFMPSPTITLLTKSAGVKWNRVVNAVKYQYALTYFPAKPLHGSYTTDTTYFIDKVNEGTAYYFHVRSVCSNGSVSEWSTIPFNTIGLQVYPNPVKDNLQIQLNGVTNSSAQIIIGDAMGRVVTRVKLINNTTSINVRGWAPGIYLVRYEDGKNKYSVRIVKQ